MLTSVQGYYDDGKVVLKEDPPIHTKRNVIVTFLPEENVTGQEGKRVLGLLEGKLSIPDDFNDPLHDLKDYM